MKWYKHLIFASIIVLSLLSFPIQWSSPPARVSHKYVTPGEKKAPPKKGILKGSPAETIELTANVMTILGNVIPISAGCAWFVTWFRSRRKDDQD